MSVGRPNGNEFITPETFLSNQAKIEQARKLLEEMEQKNRMGLQNYTERERQQQAAEQLLKQKQALQQKIQEGLEAQRLIEELERQQSTPFLQLTGGQTGGGARIEEVHDNQTISPTLLGTSSAGTMTGTNAVWPDQIPQHPQQYASNPVLTTHAYNSGVSGSLASTSTLPSQYPSLNTVINVIKDQHNQYAVAQPTHGSETIFRQYQPPNFSVPQPSTGRVDQNASSQAYNVPPSHSAHSLHRVHQAPHHASNIPVHQPVPGHLSNSYDIHRQTQTSPPPGVTLPSHVTYREQKSPTNVAIGSAPQATPSEPSALQINSHWVDNYGVPFIPLTEEQLVDMHRRLNNWRRQAPPGTIDKLHDMIHLHKDTTKHSTTWIYVPAAPGSSTFARTAEVDKFFNIFADNARMARVALSSGSNNQKAENEIRDRPTTSTVKPTPVAEQSGQRTKPPRPAPSTLFSHSTVVNSAPQPKPLEPNAAAPSTAATLGNVKSAPPPASVQAPNKELVSPPSGLARHPPMLSQVDKKNLSQNLLFALGKRSRPSLGTTSDEQPAKKHASDATSAKEPMTPSVPSASALQAKPMSLSNVTTPNISTSTSSVNPKPLGIKSTPSLAQAAPVRDIGDPYSSVTSQSNTSSTVAETSAPVPGTAPGKKTVILEHPPIAVLNTAESTPTPYPGPSSSSTVHRPSTSSSSSSIRSEIGLGRRKTPPATNLLPLSGTSGQAASAPQTTIATDSGKGKAPGGFPNSAKPHQYNPYSHLLSSQSGSLGQPSIAAQPATVGDSDKGKSREVPITSATSAQLNVPAHLSSQTSSAQVFSIPFATSDVTTPSVIMRTDPTPSTSSTVGTFPYYNIFSSQPTAYQRSEEGPRTSNEREPLFLPSSSPERGPSASTIIKSEQDSRAGSLGQNVKKRKKIAYVLVPDPPEYLVRHRQRMARGEGSSSDIEGTRKVFQMLRTGTNSVSTSVAGEEVSNTDSIEEIQRDSPIAGSREQEALSLACSRLQLLSCRWDGCSVKLNCVNALIRHLGLHKPAPTANNRHFTCRWSHCGRRCTMEEKHLEKHPLLSLKCAYKDCEECYRSGSQLLKHHDAKHTRDELKPSAEVSTSNLSSPPPVPGTVPAYLFVTKLATPATITPERHEVLCRWVVRNIVNSDQEKPTRMRTRKTAKNRVPPPPAPGNDYEFITTRSTRYSSYLSQAVDLPLEDLDSANISRMVDEGLTLWYPEEGTELVPMMSSQPDAGTIKVEEDNAVTVDTSADTDATGLDRQHWEHNRDVDAVEVMLTEQ